MSIIACHTHVTKNILVSHMEIELAYLWLSCHFQAWRLWNEKRPVEMTDDLLDDSMNPSEILRCIHVGLLCVQQRPEDRPNMSSVVLMLNGEKLLPEPSQPGFYTGRDHPTQTDSSSRNCDECSLNEVSNSLLEAR